MNPKSENARCVVPGVSRRERLLGIAAGLAVMALALFGFIKMGSGIAGATLEGRIVAKHFTPFAEAQVTFGKAGVRRVEGEYVLECEARGRAYLVRVDKEIYEARRIGERFLFPRPQPEPPGGPP